MLNQDQHSPAVERFAGLFYFVVETVLYLFLPLKQTVSLASKD